MVVLWVVCAALVGALFLVALRLHQSRERVGQVQARLASVLGRNSTGLSIWSSDGRLVACNERFREFYPDVPINRGLEFEDLVRFTVTRGLVQVPDDEVESWVTTRLAGRNEPTHDVVRTAEGRWLAVDVGPTDHGEMLMLYTDVTERRDAEIGIVELTAQVRAREAEGDLLLGVVEATSGADSFESAARRLVDLVCDWAGWPVGHAYRVDAEASLVFPLPETRRTSDAFASLQTAWDDVTPRPAEDLVGRVLQTGRVVWVASLQSDPTFSAEQRAIMTNIRGACGVPIARGGRVVGVLEFLSPEPLVPSPSQTALLRAVGEILGSV